MDTIPNVLPHVVGEDDRFAMVRPWDGASSPVQVNSSDEPM